MALRYVHQIKRITASGGGTLQADQDESFLIRGIYCNPSSNDDYITVYVQGTAVGKFRVKGLSGNHLAYPAMQVNQAYEGVVPNLFEYARSIGFPLDIPIASGETLTISRYAETGDVCVLYDVFDAGDIRPDQDNGSRANKRRYIHYGTNTSAITSSPAGVNKSLIWSGGSGFPFDGSSVAERNIYRVKAILGCPCTGGDGSANKGYTTHLVLISDNNYLFDEDRNGLPFLSDSSYTTDATGYKEVASVIGALTAEHPKPALVLDPPLEFPEGKQLTVQVRVSSAAADGIEANEIDVAFLMEQEYLAGRVR